MAAMDNPWRNGRGPGMSGLVRAKKTLSVPSECETFNDGVRSRGPQCIVAHAVGVGDTWGRAMRQAREGTVVHHERQMLQSLTEHLPDFDKGTFQEITWLL